MEYPGIVPMISAAISASASTSAPRVVWRSGSTVGGRAESLHPSDPGSLGCSLVAVIVASRLITRARAGDPFLYRVQVAASTASAPAHLHQRSRTLHNPGQVRHSEALIHGELSGNTGQRPCWLAGRPRELPPGLCAPPGADRARHPVGGPRGPGDRSGGPVRSTPMLSALVDRGPSTSRRRERSHAAP